jgi:predicted metal-dependent peptidase
MFISSKEKQFFHDTLNDLNGRLSAVVEFYKNQIAALKKENSELSKRVNSLAVMGIADSAREKTIEKFIEQSTTPISDTEKALLHAAYRKEYAKQYYWRKKAERIADGSKEKIRGHKGVANVSENANHTSV